MNSYRFIQTIIIRSKTLIESTARFLLGHYFETLMPYLFDPMFRTPAKVQLLLSVGPHRRAGRRGWQASERITDGMRKERSDHLPTHAACVALNL